MMYGRGKSSPVIVAGKPANKAQPDSVTAAESVERRAGAKGNANQPARTGLSAGSRVVLAPASIRRAARLDCQYPRWEPYAGKLHVRVCAGGARQLASLPRLRRRARMAGRQRRELVHARVEERTVGHQDATSTLLRKSCEGRFEFAIVSG